jgi:hypothetical protein
LMILPRRRIFVDVVLDHVLRVATVGVLRQPRICLGVIVASPFKHIRFR